MKFLETFAVGILASIIAFYLCEKVFPLLSTVMINYPFESFVVIILTVITVLLTVVTTHQLKRNAS